MLSQQWDPLAPGAPHAPADGSVGVVVGDDTARLPRVRLRRRGCLVLWLLAGVTASVLLVLAVAFAPHAGGEPPIVRADDLVCRCGPRPPLHEGVPQ